MDHFSGPFKSADFPGSTYYRKTCSEICCIKAKKFYFVLCSKVMEMKMHVQMYICNSIYSYVNVMLLLKCLYMKRVTVAVDYK